jgi:hypothetical protein
MNPAILGIAGGVLQAGIGLIGGARQKRMAKQAAKQANYLNQKSIGYANENLGIAQGLLSESRNNYNARMAGASDLQNNIYQSQANAIGNISKNATDSSQLLALAGASQGMATNAFNDLALNEAQSKQQRFGDVQNATSGVQNATMNLQNVYGQQAQQAQESANQLRQSGAMNQYNAVGGLANAGMIASGLLGSSGGAPPPMPGRDMRYTPVQPIGSVSMGLPKISSGLSSTSSGVGSMPVSSTSQIQYNQPFYYPR